VQILEHLNTMSVATSPNGKWIATGTHNGFGVKVWDAQTGEMLKYLIPDERIVQVYASPDGRWLLTGTPAAFDFWKADSWEHERQIQLPPGGGTGSAAFSPDSRLLAISLSTSVVQLLEAESGRVVARLQPPDADVITWMSFSPDGSQLAVASGANVIRLWDLRSIREQLQPYGLDWDLPAYRPAPPREETGPPQFDIDLGDFQHAESARQHFSNARNHSLAGQWREVVVEYDAGLALQPENALALNNLAWCLATCPDQGLRDFKRAVELAARATTLSSQNAACWNTLGVARYYAGDCRAAIDALTRSNELSQGRYVAFNALFVAMAHWQLGEHDIALQRYTDAANWIDKFAPEDPELRRFRAEAVELLGLTESTSASP
jgi:dipeptidyl aminopeptidase/acylaminoacyl peptidase